MNAGEHEGRPRPQPGPILWLMGPTSAGKTTIAAALVERLRAQEVRALHYDGDEIRDLFGDLDFTGASRLRVVGALVALATKASDAGLAVVVSALTANPDARRLVVGLGERLVLCHVDCPIDVCAARDPKQLYRRAQRGEIDTLIGVNTPYLAPENPDIVLATDRLSVAECVEQLLRKLALTEGNRP